MMEALKILRSPGLREVRRHDRNGPYLNSTLVLHGGFGSNAHDS